MPKRIGTLPTLSLLLIFTTLAFAQTQKDVNGRVFEADTKRGIENLEVKLTPPNNSGLPIRLANTGQNGTFRFAQVTQSHYLLEVSQGANLLYRVEVDLATTGDLEIPLQKR
jgi:hypothetical protein